MSSESQAWHGYTRLLHLPLVSASSLCLVLVAAARDRPEW